MCPFRLHGPFLAACNCCTAAGVIPILILAIKHVTDALQMQWFLVPKVIQGLGSGDYHKQVALTAKLAQLAGMLLRVHSSLVALHGCLYSNKHLQDTAVPVADLAASLVDGHAALAALASASSSSGRAAKAALSPSSGTSATVDNLAPLQLAAYAAQLLAHQAAVEPLTPGQLKAWYQHPLMQLLNDSFNIQNDHLTSMLALNLALAVHGLRRTVGSASPVAAPVVPLSRKAALREQQQQRVEAERLSVPVNDMALLCAFGRVSSTRSSSGGGSGSSSSGSSGGSGCCCDLGNWQCTDDQAALILAASNIHTFNNSAEQSCLEAVKALRATCTMQRPMPLNLRMPLLQVLLQLQLLVPKVEVVVESLELMTCLVSQSCSSAATDTVFGSQGAVANRAAEMAPFLRPVMQLLAPAVLHCMQHSEAAAATAATMEEEDVRRDCGATAAQRLAEGESKENIMARYGEILYMLTVCGKFWHGVCGSISATCRKSKGFTLLWLPTGDWQPG